MLFGSTLCHAGGTMATIFLSYCREDVSAAEAIASALEREGYSVWWDRHIKGGRQFAREIEAALESAVKVVVLWSKASVNSAWVRDEAAIARDTNRLVPVSIDGILAPLGFRQYQTIDMRGGKAGRRACLDALLAAVSDQSSQPEASPVHARGPSSRFYVGAAAVCLALAGAAGLYFSGNLGPRPASAVSLAVLPFDALPADETNSPFAEGVSEEILGQLARNPKLRLVGRTSAETFRGHKTDARTIGGKLHVAYLLDGTVRRSGKEVRVAVELVRAADGVELWRHSYSGQLNDIFAIQESIGAQVEGQLRAQFAGAKGVTPSTLATSGEVYGYYLTARGLVRSRDLANVEAAIGLLRRALAIDPNYAPAWAELAIATRIRRYLGTGIVDEAADRERAVAIGYADRAKALAPQLAEAHIAKAIALEALDDNGDDGKPELLIAARLDPNDAETWAALARCYEWEGYFPQEMMAYRRVIAIDPIWWPALFHATDLAWQLGYEAESREYVRRVERDYAGRFEAHLVRNKMAYQSGDLSNALQEGLAARRLADAGSRPFIDRQIGYALRAAGFADRARRYWWYDVDDTMWSLWNGRALSSNTIERLYRNPGVEWTNQMVTFALLKTLVSSHRSAEAVTLYHRRFSSPEEMLRYPSGHLGLLEDGATIALALQDTGERAEADRLLSLLRREAQERLKLGPVPRDYGYYMAMVQAAGGDKEGAIRALQQSVGRRWFYTHERSFGDLTMEPAFRSLLNDTRFQRIVNQQRAWQQKERREMVPLLTPLSA
jgi:adenylate cyclase